MGLFPGTTLVMETSNDGEIRLRIVPDAPEIVNKEGVLVVRSKAVGDLEETMRHEPMRHFLGGFRCAVCGLVGADLGVMGFDGYVSPMRLTYSRDHGQITRSSKDAA